MHSQDFENRLKAQVDFPSPSRVATDIIALARDPDIEMAKVAQAVGRDPAMTAKILRIANSAFYAQRRPSQNLRQALVVIGLNAALTLALSFSLVSSMRALRARWHRLPPLLASRAPRRDRRSRLLRVGEIRARRRRLSRGPAAGHGRSRARSGDARFLQQAAAARDACSLDRLRNGASWAAIMLRTPRCCSRRGISPSASARPSKAATHRRPSAARPTRAGSPAASPSAAIWRKPS